MRPTGIGKSHIAATIALSLGTSFIVTAQKILQDQYTKDFKFVYSAKGKQNFPCIDLYDVQKLDYDTARKDPKLSCISGDCIKSKNTPCSFKPTLETFEKKYDGTEREIIIEPESQSCYYYVQKYQALFASYSSYNYASYFQTRLFSNGIEKLLERNCIIADEAHEIEEQIIGFIGHTIIQKHLDGKLVWHILPTLTDDMMTNEIVRCRTIPQTADESVIFETETKPWISIGPLIITYKEWQMGVILGFRRPQTEENLMYGSSRHNELSAEFIAEYERKANEPEQINA